MTALTGHRVPGTLRHLPMMDEGETQGFRMIFDVGR